MTVVFLLGNNTVSHFRYTGTRNDTCVGKTLYILPCTSILSRISGIAASGYHFQIENHDHAVLEIFSKFVSTGDVLSRN